MIAPKMTRRKRLVSLSRPTTAQIIFGGYLAFIALIILLKDMDRGQSVFNLFNGLKHADKVAHFLLFGLLTYLLSFALRHKRIKLMTIRISLAPVIMLIATFVEECSQIGLESRTFSLLDMLANLVGVLYFGYLAIWFTKTKDIKER